MKHVLLFTLALTAVSLSLECLAGDGYKTSTLIKREVRRTEGSPTYRRARVFDKSAREKRYGIVKQGTNGKWYRSDRHDPWKPKRRPD
ncbi:MAG: hypothetical protein DRR42_09175 [Gammaproteobacteria bacterium]|nr:MAG: hypothetical protein DRR42_09175 [Gammaproteobacteria bacterium]